MPEITNIIFQPFDDKASFASLINETLAQDWVEKIIISSAYLSSGGVTAIEKALGGNEVEAFIGVRNGATTAQGVLQLFSKTQNIYLIDTATRQRIFHSKFYLASSSSKAEVILASANLTHGGMFNNIETGIRISLDLSNSDDQTLLSGLLDPLQNLKSKHSGNCYPVTKRKDIVEFMRQGVLEDERITRVYSKARSAQTTEEDDTNVKHTPPAISLPYKSPAPKRRRAGPRRSRTHMQPDRPLSAEYGDLLWKKPSLPSGDLQILEKSNTSGVLRLTQARFEVNGERINQTTYFRHDIFGNLEWQVDQHDSNKEVVEARFGLVISGVQKGSYLLKLSHKDAWESGQGNYTTGLHWGEATPQIKDDGLVGRPLRLYSSETEGIDFFIEID